MKSVGFFFILMMLIASVTIVPPIRSETPTYFKVVIVYWGVDHPIEVSPGDVATLAVIVQMSTYESAPTVQGVKAELSLPEGFKAVGGDKALTYYSGTISLGSVIRLEFPIYIGRDAVKGRYSTGINLTYYIGQNLPREEVLDIAFEVTGKPDIDIEAQDISVREGSQQTYVTIFNEGDAVADNLEVASINSNSASVELEKERSLGELEPGNKVIVPLRLFVPTGMSGKIMSLNIDVGCLGPRNVAYSFSETLQLPVKPSNPAPPLALSLDPNEVTIGKSNKVHIDLFNTGDRRLSEIRLTLSPDNILKIFGSTNLYLDTLGPKDHLRIETEVYVPSTAITPTASLAVTVTYLDDDLWMTYTESSLLSVLLRGLIEITMTDVAVIPSAPHPGGPFSITITITNLGTTTAYAGYAIPVLEDLPLKTFGPKSVYIGNIELNLPTTFTINLQLENTTESKIALPVTLRYMDNLRSTYNITFSIPINVGSQTSPPSQTPGTGGYLATGNLVIGAIAIVAVVAAVIIIVRRRR